MIDIGHVLAGKYRVERHLGQGGMGAVYEVFHEVLQARFAVKVLTLDIEDDSEVVKRFIREARIASGLRHRHIVQVTDFGHTAQGQPFFVMELLRGETLQRRLSGGRYLSVEDAALILRQAASALQLAHQNRVVHRDLKPANIFLCHAPDGQVVVKILDFGISKVLGSESIMTQANLRMGSLHYMAPEQAEGNTARADRRTDVFAMGAVLYRALTGQVPFDAEIREVVYHKIVAVDPPPLRSLRPELSPELEAVVTRAMHKDPARRFDSMAELSAAFDDAVEHGTKPRTINAGREPPHQTRASRLGWFVIAALLAVLGLAIGMLVHRGLRPGSRPNAAASPSPVAVALPVAPAPAVRPVRKRPQPAVASKARPDPGGMARRSRVRDTQRRPFRPRKKQRSGSGQSATGTLEVVTTMGGGSIWADVYLDGKHVGQTPITLREIAAGTYALRVQRKGFRMDSELVTVQAGKVKKVPFIMEREQQETNENQ